MKRMRVEQRIEILDVERRRRRLDLVDEQRLARLAAVPGVGRRRGPPRARIADRAPPSTSGRNGM